MLFQSQSVQGVGENLVNIAKGILDFSNFTYKDAEGKVVRLSDKAITEEIPKKIQSVLMSIASVFQAVGTKGEAGFWKGNLIAKGIESVKGVGDEVVKIATAVKDFANLTYSNMDDHSKRAIKLTPNDIDLVGLNIKSGIYAIL